MQLCASLPLLWCGHLVYRDAGEKPAIVAQEHLESLPVRSGEVASLPDQTADDDAAWARAAAEATSASLHRYLGRYPQGRHAQKAMDDLNQVAGVEVAIAKDYGSQDAAALQQALLRRYLAEYPTGQLADEARGKLAMLETASRRDVAWSEQKAGKQVAVLAPTTRLVQQHLANFRDRFADWPVRVEGLSRFGSSKETQAVLEGLEQGKVDIVIATHRLLHAHARFRDLGLLIID